MHHFFVRSNYIWKLRSVPFWFVDLLYFLRQNYIINDSATMTCFSWPQNYVFVVSLYQVWKQRYNCALFLFVIVKYFLLRCNYVIYLFHKVTFFSDVRIAFYFGTFEITLQLRFVFVRHCESFFITSQLRYLFFPCSYFFLLRITYRNFVIKWSFFSYVCL